MQPCSPHTVRSRPRGRARASVTLLRALSLVILGGVGADAAAQDQPEWQLRFAAGEAARQSGSVGTYADEMAAAARLIPAGAPDRAVVQYHAARAAALAGRDAGAIGPLRSIWEEGQGHLMMLSFAERDPAFGRLLGNPDFRSVLGELQGVPVRTQRLADGVYLVEGSGANVVAAIADDGSTLLIDTGYGAPFSAVRSALAELGAERIEGLIVTHAHEDHMGGAEMVEGGTIVAHPAARRAMSEPYYFLEGVSVPGKDESALPDIEVRRDTTWVMAGSRIRVLPTSAHSPGDLSVYLVDAGVAHLGDAFLPSNAMLFPGQTDPDGFLDRFAAFLDDMDPSTVIVSGHEAVSDVNAVRLQIATTRACMAYVRESLEKGLSIEDTARGAEDRFPAAWIAFFYGLFASR